MPELDPPDNDPFGPPAISTMVGCLHCGEEYDSYKIEWRILSGSDGKPHGFWCCPTPGCDGIGFGFDILPTDRNYRDEHGGWFSDDGDEDEEEDEDEDDYDDENDLDNLLDPPSPGENGTGKPKLDDDDEGLPW